MTAGCFGAPRWPPLGIDHTDVPNGARIRYTATEPVLVGALHAGFDAQASDHGGHTHG